MANGYLQYGRQWTVKYCKKTVLRYMHFYFRWTILVGIVETVVSGRITLTPIRAALGKGTLFQLWFLPALCFIVVINFLINNIQIRQGKSFQSFATIRGAVMVCILMLIEYCVSIAMARVGLPEIRDIVPPPLRIVTNYGYFYLGMVIKKQNIASDILKKHRGILVISVLITYGATCALAQSLDLIWASSHYTSPFIVLGSSLIFILLVEVKSIPKVIRRAVTMSTGIWVLHVFIIRVTEKMYEMLGISELLILKCFDVFVILIVCQLIISIAMKNRYLKKLVEV